VRYINGIYHAWNVEYVSSDLMLPSVGLPTALFAGWILACRIVRDELRGAPDWPFTT
jgi:hypothetical protein